MGHAGHEAAGNELRGLAPGVEVGGVGAVRQDVAREVVSERIRGRAISVTGVGTIEVSVVERRNPAAVEDCGEVECRHDDDPAAHLRGRQGAGEIVQEQLTLVLVAVSARGEEYRRSLSAVDHDDRHRDESVVDIGGRRVDEPDVPDRAAGGLEIDVAADPRRRVELLRCHVGPCLVG